MKMPVRPHLVRLFGAALLVCSSLAQAQYAWIDDKGVRQFSDRPPPPGTPASKILKAPGKAFGTEPAQDKQTEQPADPRPAGQPTLAEREADYKKRALERAKQEKKAAQDAEHERAKADNCENARRSRALLESGVRVREMDANGETTFLSDEERAARVARANKVLEGCH